MWKLIKIIVVLAVIYAALRYFGIWPDFVHAIKSIFAWIGGEILWFIGGVIVLGLAVWFFVFRK